MFFSTAGACGVVAAGLTPRSRPRGASGRRRPGAAGWCCRATGAADFDGHGVAVAVANDAPVEVFVFERAEEPLDHPVGLRGPDAGPDVAQQRLNAGEGLSEGLTAKARPVIRHDCDRHQHVPDDLPGRVRDRRLVQILAQVIQAGQASCRGDGLVQAGQGVDAAAGGGDSGGQAVLGGVVDDRADPPDPSTGGLELREVGLPDPIPAGARVAEHLPAQLRPGSPISPIPARQQQTPPTQRALDGRGGDLLAVGAQQGAILRCPTRASRRRISRPGRRSRRSPAPARAPSPARPLGPRPNGGGRCARGCLSTARTSKPGTPRWFSGLRGL